MKLLTPVLLRVTSCSSQPEVTGLRAEMPPASVASASAHLIDTRTYRGNVPFNRIGLSPDWRFHPRSRPSQPRHHQLSFPPCRVPVMANSPDPSDRAAVRDYVLGGPLIDQLSISREDATDDEVDRWTSVATRLCEQLSMDQTSLDPAQASRVYRYYLPVYLWCVARLDAHRSNAAPGGACPPLVVGLSAPQGCGKTTLVTQLTKLLESDGVRAASVSIDDVYLTGEEQERVAADHPTNTLLRFRGNPGSHDVPLGIATIESLRLLNDAGSGGEDGGGAQVRQDDAHGTRGQGAARCLAGGHRAAARGSAGGLDAGFLARGGRSRGGDEPAPRTRRPGAARRRVRPASRRGGRLGGGGGGGQVVGEGVEAGG